jgi:uncharacterized membrane protein
MSKVVCKTITWRMTAIVLSAIIVYVFTGSVSQSLGSVVVANIVSTLAYYVHEKLWDRVKRD